MRRRQPLPRLWLITDERQGEALWEALERLPRRSGVVFRHYGLAAAARRALFARVTEVARRRALLVVAAGAPLAGAGGTHGRRGPGVRTASAHDLRELRAAERAGADLVFLSPVFPTRSHPGGVTLGARGFERLARRARVPVVALGGMDAGKARMLRGAYGWAGIDALTADRESPEA
jgi:thiamine-phosphate pyrophosphorylase